jgi:hypothetical protein
MTPEELASVTLEHLRLIRAQQTEQGEQLGRIESRLSSLETTVAGMRRDLATQRDIESLRVDIKQDITKLDSRLSVIEERTEGRFKLLQWMLGFNLAISIALLWILIRTATH